MKELPAPLITETSVMTAVVRMADVIPFFPQTPAAKETIAQAIGQFVTDQAELNWLTSAAIHTQREWGGVAELRGLFSTRYKPKDGIVTECLTPGYRRDDQLAEAERSYFERESAATEENLRRWKAEKLLHPPESWAPLPELPALKRIPAAPALERVQQSAPADRRPLTEIEAEIARSMRPARTPEETARLTRELEEQLARRLKA